MPRPPVKHVEVRPGIYRDSVALMRVSAELASAPGVERALVAMATPVNLELLAGMGLAAPTAAGANDLVVAVTTGSDEALVGALERLEALLAGPAPGAPSPSELAVAPRTTASAARLVGGGIALVSTPGPYAFVEAMDALDAGLSVMVFSDNVPVAQEVQLKRRASELGLLVMGPDCGTAVVGGVGLGFANVVRPGPVGIVAASGTGAQQVMALLAAAGVGVSHCLGVGGWDLSDVVGGRSTHAALDALDADADTELIVVLGKPPAPGVADEVRAHAARLRTPTLVAPLAADSPDLTEIVTGVLSRLGATVPTWPVWAPTGSRPAARAGGWLRGLYSGGTLCVEAQAVASATLSPVRSNVPLSPQWSVDVGTAGKPGAEGHLLLDLGADEFTVGRPHPMLDPAARLPLLRRWGADPRVSVILLDVVLGHGAHPDPASVLAPAVADALAGAMRRSPAPGAAQPTVPGEERALGAGPARALAPLSVVVALIGTPGDPQDLTRQASTLAAAGAQVYLSNAGAARHAADLASTGGAR